MARIGLLGGSFNPAHGGHRHISLQAMRSLGLDEAWWLVSPGNPLKEGAKDMAPFEARFASAVAAARRAPIRVSDFERRARISPPHPAAKERVDASLARARGLIGLSTDAVVDERKGRKKAQARGRRPVT